jgi:hypothetical protein
MASAANRAAPRAELAFLPRSRPRRFLLGGTGGENLFGQR